MKVEDKARLIKMMDGLADECCGIALGREVARLKMHPDFNSRKILQSEDEFVEFLDIGLARLGLHILVGECQRLAEQFERDLSSPPGEIIQINDLKADDESDPG